MKQLSLIEKAFFLKKISLFNTLELDLLLAIADKMSQDLYDKNERIFQINQIANRMYFIVEGTVQIEDPSSDEPVMLEAQEFFGEEGLFNEKKRKYAAHCLCDTLFLTISRSNLLTIISECPSIAIALLQCYANVFSFRGKIIDSLMDNQ